MFEYPKGLPNLELITPQRMWRLKLRRDCARNMYGIYAAGPLLRSKVSSYPNPNRWCDDLIQFCRNQYDSRDGVKVRRFTENWISMVFLCPSASKYISGEQHFTKNLDPSLLKCNYALNPECNPNSPSDVVLLFETKAGWNQHGGPELFTFDNHEPKGGCVLLNDGTSKFIRTKEELQQLRWK
jgi:hypothetical protein